MIDEVKEQPRLATGVAATGRLDAAAIERAFAGAAPDGGCASAAASAGSTAVATAAVREAATGEQFVRRVRDELGSRLRIIDADHEAALSYRSVAHHFPLEGGRTIVADIGGGSLELIGAVDGLIEYSTSLPSAPFASPRPAPGQARQPQGGRAHSATRSGEQFRKAFPSRDWVGRHPDRLGRLVHQPGPDGRRPARHAAARTRCTAPP